jgi:hypothetical protein
MDTYQLGTSFSKNFPYYFSTGDSKSNNQYPNNQTGADQPKFRMLVIGVWLLFGDWLLVLGAYTHPLLNPFALSNLFIG